MPTLTGVPQPEALLPESTEGVAYLRAIDPDGRSVKAHPVFVTVKDRGAAGDGVETENTAFAALYADSSEIFVDAGTYKISPEINLTEKDVHIVVHPDATFTTAAWDMGPIVKAIGTNPVLAFDGFFKTVGTEYDLYEHVVGRSIFMQADTTGPVVVSLYANCEVIESGAYGFGANFGVYMTETGGVGVGLEIDTHVTASGTTATALALDSVGSFPSTQAIIIQPNNANSPFGIGINFNNANGNNAITTKAIRFTGAGTSEHFLYAPDNMTFSSAVIETNTFIAGPSVASFNSLLRVDASASGSPKLSAVGAATNAGVVIQGKGTGGGSLVDGALNTKMAWNTTGVGWFNTTPVAKQSLPSALSTGGAETNTNICTAINTIRTLILNYGLGA